MHRRPYPHKSASDVASAFDQGVSVGTAMGRWVIVSDLADWFKNSTVSCTRLVCRRTPATRDCRSHGRRHTTEDLPRREGRPA